MKSRAQRWQKSASANILKKPGIAILSFPATITSLSQQAEVDTTQK
jgi:hypothetical protein